MATAVPAHELRSPARAPLAELIDELAPKTVVTDPAVVAAYREDGAHAPSTAEPLAVVRARSTADVQATLRWAGRHRVPVVPRGAGTGLSGGSIAVDGAVVLSVEAMRELHVDPATRTAVAQPGVLNVAVKAAAAEHGLWYPPDPSSFEICSIGGNVATNAGGLCCVKYGVTADYVLGLEVVLPDGEVVRLGGPRLKDSAGLSLTKLFVGSEGTLGVVTEVTLRLIPAPEPHSTMVALFPTTRAAADAVLAITAGMRPSMLEFMDRNAIAAAESRLRMGLDPEAAAMLIARSDAPGSQAAREIESMAAICTQNGATEVFHTDDPEEGEAFAAARRTAFPALERQGSLLLEDVGVPLTALPDLIAGFDAIAADRDVTIATVAHAGDGNTHPMVVYDPRDADMHARAQAAFDDIMALAISLGGTISGEHGVGRLKRSWLPEYLGPEAMRLNERIKNALDPAGIMNPGTMFAAPSSTTAD
ncbi:FAD-binding oxidoreductase [Gordonia aichiensis]|uniref:FAD-binding oxidoreductase n=1 Tax=Gordonia aichiensis TaxID=36820 RepID=UPI0032652D68